MGKGVKLVRCYFPLLTVQVNYFPTVAQPPPLHPRHCDNMAGPEVNIWITDVCARFHFLSRWQQISLAISRVSRAIPNKRRLPHSPLLSGMAEPPCHVLLTKSILSRRQRGLEGKGYCLLLGLSSQLCVLQRWDGGSERKRVCGGASQIHSEHPSTHFNMRRHLTAHLSLKYS